MSKPDGGPAYPCNLGMSGYGHIIPMEGPRGHEWCELSVGKSIRDDFAESAMQALLSKYNLNSPEDQTVIAKLSWQLADAMLAERNKE